MKNLSGAGIAQEFPEKFSRVYRIGTAKTRGGRGYSVYVHIKYGIDTYQEPGDLSITGVEGPLSSGGCLGGFGQIDMYSWNIENYANGWDWSSEQELRRIWDKYHLNGWCKPTVPDSVLVWLYTRPLCDIQPAWV